MGRIRIALVTTIAVAAAVPASAAAHGELLSSAPLTGPAVLTGAAENRYVTYATDGIGGKPVAVSGTIAIPKGTPPAGGWPVVSWAHGTTGIADQCAPSVTGSGPVTFLNRLLDAGYAVVRTDYEGLGTPGDHPYLNGPSEGRSVLDIVRAARAAVPGLSKRVLLAGHSQGGHAALWAAAIGPSWTPELKIRGTVAFAPASFLGLQAYWLRFLPTKQFSGLAGAILRGADISAPWLKVGQQLTDKARALWPETLTKCSSELSLEDSWGGLNANEIVRPGTDVTWTVDVLSRNGPENLTIYSPVTILQGEADGTALKPITDLLAIGYLLRGMAITYRTFPQYSHGDIVAKADSQDAALAALNAWR